MENKNDGAIEDVVDKNENNKQSVLINTDKMKITVIDAVYLSLYPTSTITHVSSFAIVQE